MSQAAAEAGSAGGIAGLSPIRSLGGLDLNEGQPQLGEPVLQLRLMLPQTPRQPFHEGGKGIDCEPGLIELGRLEREVKGAELKQAKGMVGDDEVNRGPGQLLLELLELSGLLLGRELRCLPAGPLGCRPALPLCRRRGLLRLRPADGSLASWCPQGAHSATLG